MTQELNRQARKGGESFLAISIFGVFSFCSKLSRASVVPAEPLTAFIFGDINIRGESRSTILNILFFANHYRFLITIWSFAY